MKKIIFVSLFILGGFFASVSFATDSREFSGKGEIVSVDTLYNRVTIKQDTIKDFSPSGEHEYLVESNDLLKGLGRRDLVTFSVEVDRSGQELVINITKTGQAEPEDDRLPVGKAVQGALETTAGAAQAITTPIAPIHDVVSATTDATTNATGAVLDDATTEVKKKF